MKGAVEDVPPSWPGLTAGGPAGPTGLVLVEAWPRAPTEVTMTSRKDFGAERVSAGERRMLDQVRAVLGMA